jgi:hypothetical protein
MFVLALILMSSFAKVPNFVGANAPLKDYVTRWSELSLILMFSLDGQQ